MRPATIALEQTACGGLILGGVFNDGIARVPSDSGAPSFTRTRASDGLSFRPWFVFAQLAERGLKTCGEFVRRAFAPVMQKNDRGMQADHVVMKGHYL